MKKCKDGRRKVNNVKERKAEKKNFENRKT